jgi:hypothetical protein
MFENADRLTRVFGRWPSFHDAEILSIHLDRGGQEGPTLEARIHVFETTSEVDAKGYFVLKSHTLVTLMFTGVTLEGMAWINGQNVLEDIEITELASTGDDGRRFHIEFIPSYGLGAAFECKAAVVVEATPFDPAA